MLNFKIRQQLVALSLLISLTLSGCGGWLASAPQAEPVKPETVEVGAAERQEQAVASEPVEEPVGESDLVGPSTSSDTAYKLEAAEEETTATTGEVAPMPYAAATAAPAEIGPDTGGVVAPQQVEALKAGEVDDNAQWDDYLLYRRDYYGPAVHDRDVSERYIIEVTDGQGYPVLGAQVRFFLPGQEKQEIYSAYTYANGQVLFHPLALAQLPLDQVDHFIVEVQQGNLLEQFNLTRFDAQVSTSFTERWTVSLDLDQQLDSLDLDVLFLVDATGSMSDEIAKVQSTIFDVSAQIDALPEQPNVRYGLVSYRDRGDSFVTNSYEFTPDVRDFAKNLNMLFADGGGDYPESLNEGLHDALNEVEWRGAGTVQLIFLIADAPPHLDYAQDYDYVVEMEHAAQRGIKIFPIASSGLDDQGEYIFRQLAQYTQGRFVFLTYAGPTNGGAPGEETTHHVDDYSVENLDDLLVRLVSEELAHQQANFAQVQ